MSWTYEHQLVEEIPEGVIGFVYLITNTTSGQKYIGKKLAQFKKTRPPLKGKKLKRRTVVESDWRDYWGSSDRLQADVQRLGPEKFTREILYYCKSKAEMSYLEAREQFERRVLESDEYYNGIINVRVGGSNILRQRLLEQAQAKSNG
jgi:Putative endonuclease segE, GIY-YIG domain